MSLCQRWQWVACPCDARFPLVPWRHACPDIILPSIFIIWDLQVPLCRIYWSKVLGTYSYNDQQVPRTGSCAKVIHKPSSAALNVMKQAISIADNVASLQEGPLIKQWWLHKNPRNWHGNNEEPERTYKIRPTQEWDLCMVISLSYQQKTGVTGKCGPTVVLEH